jgi:Domain of unknown function (DUF397)
MEDDRALIWRKSSYSGNNGGQCVEISAPGSVLVRDSKDPHGTVLEFAPQTWRKFAGQTKNDAGLYRYERMARGSAT